MLGNGREKKLKNRFWVSVSMPSRWAFFCSTIKIRSVDIKRETISWLYTAHWWIPYVCDLFRNMHNFFQIGFPVYKKMQICQRLFQKNLNKYTNAYLRHGRLYRWTENSFQKIFIPYARHYNPQFVYFLTTFWSPKTFFQGAFFLKFWPYVWLVFKSGF